MSMRRRTHRHALTLTATAAVAAVAVTLAGCTSGGTGSTMTGAGSGQGSALRWSPCTVGGVQGGVQMDCANLQVPLDYSHPGGRKITLALSMVPATAPVSQQQGDLLVNPGGPGASGRSLAVSVAQGLNPAVAADYNIIGFDPRGVGASVPALHCDPGFFSGVRPDYIPANAAAEQVLVNRAKAYAAGCEKRFGWMLPYMTTKDAARDMDSIRAALHQQKISYYGFSYGTYLGEVYGTLFPNRVRRMVLDSTVDPAGVWYTDNINQDYAFQGRMQAFFTWTGQHNSSYHLGSTAAQVQQAWYTARNRLKAHPISGSSGPMIGADEYDDTFLQGGYNDTFWPGLAQALSQYLRARSTTAIVTEYQVLGVQNENEFAVYNAVQCSDVNWPRSWAKWNSDARKVYKTAPFQAWDNTWYNAACAFWPVKGPAQPMQIKGSGLPGILMLQGTLDAATPYAGAQVAHKLLPSARMVVVENGGDHGQSMENPSDTCVQNYLNSYLSTGALPGHAGLVNATCAPVPDPSPSS
ncbi:MAG TPA: alpha/beta hydrolase [Streptosporangiaceae bacterium]|jgi:pimeloyl-ACP methyl ester carboxylesterase|nr:alpha/beta hydrolase [Streptosporangiaceae bacterium]